MTPRIEAILRAGLRREGWPAPARAQAADRGGLTRGGITAANWGSYKKLGRSASRVELDAITESEALAFYNQRYVIGSGFEKVENEKLQELLIDWAFTSWYDDPTRALQRCLQQCGLYNGVVDGVFGPRTLIALQCCESQATLYYGVLAARIDFYLSLGFDRQTREYLDTHPTSLLHFVRGWVIGCLELLQHA
jgi:lysozyme family protein